jgi:hypothetical protein
VTGGTRSIDARKILWLWPRVEKAGIVLVARLIDPFTGALINMTSPTTCKVDGTPDPQGAFLLVELAKSPTPKFVKDEQVRLRNVALPASADQMATFSFVVEAVLPGDRIVLRRLPPTPSQLGYENAVASQFELDLFKRLPMGGILCALIAPRHAANGDEMKIVTDSILQHIDITNSPLNAPQSAQAQACTPPVASSASSRKSRARLDVTPTNLPAGFADWPPKGHKHPLAKSDIVGIYDGGGGFDCGVYRPAGRCRMRRAGLATVPFCRVCTYVIVDQLDPTVHRKLDKLYP